MTSGTARESYKSDKGGNRGGAGCRVYDGRGISPEEEQEVTLYIFETLVQQKQTLQGLKDVRGVV